MFNYLYHLILLLIIANIRPSNQELLGYKEWQHSCTDVISRRYQSLHSAWDDCAARKNCKGVIEENCSGTSFYACGESVQYQGLDGCFYRKY